MAPRSSTFAPWATPDMLPPMPAEVTPETKLDALQAATDVLFQFTGRQWPGIGTDLLRPAAMWCDDKLATWEIELPWQPVTEIIAVTIEGVTIDPDTYRVDSSKRLVRLRDSQGVRQSWPIRQDPTRELGEVDTWGIEYHHGAAPPIGGVRSSVTLAEQLALAWTPQTDQPCRLPKRVQSISRQGVQLVAIDPLTLFREGRTGLGEVDLWIGSVVIGKDRRPGAVVDVAGTGPVTRPRFRSHGAIFGNGPSFRQ